MIGTHWQILKLFINKQYIYKYLYMYTIIRMLKNQRINLICNNRIIGNVRIENGIMQDDSLSPKLLLLLLNR